MKTNPADFTRRILLAVTGLSPQILTETLYALAAAPDAPGFVPTEIHLLTTSTGKDLARTALLHADGGQYHALLSDYPQLASAVFDDSTIHVITAADGTPLPDIRTPDENAAAADAITALVAELTRNEHAALHVSIAGGRKTMGFYLGYAFSLYARPQDRLSHVLVSAPFESHPEFFFPPAAPRRLTTRDNRHIDTADATITLAEIPVVRLRHGMPDALLQGRTRYNETVTELQDSFAPPSLRIDLSKQEVWCGRRIVNLPPALLAWFGWWAQQVLEGQPMLHWREAQEHKESYLALYKCVVGQDAEALENAKVRLKDDFKYVFEQNNAKLERALRTQLSMAAAPYLLDREGKRNAMRRGLRLPMSAVQLIKDSR